jgi:hypothetical protein
MKGQYLTVEYMLFFIIGVSMVVSVYFIFSDLNSILEGSTVKSQMKSVGETIRGTIINLLDASSSTDSEIRYNLSIPLRLSNCVYVIEVYNDLNLNCTRDMSIGTVLSLYNLNIKTENIIYSTKGYVEMTAYNGTVELK